VKTETEIADEELGFRQERRTRDQLRIAQGTQHQQPLYMCFMDFKKAFDLIFHDKLWVTMVNMGYTLHLIDLLPNHTGNSSLRSKYTARSLSEWFRVKKGARQGYVRLKADKIASLI